MRTFTVPPTATDKNGEVKLEYAFQIKAEFDPEHVAKTARGRRIYQSITGGVVKGPKLNGTVYPDSGGEYGLVRSDKVADINTRFMLKAENDEWIYVEHQGYRRPDGYYRVMAYIDADSRGAYTWLNNSVLIATAQEAPDRQQILFTYYLAA